MTNENGHEWKVLRKHLSPPLTNRKTPAYYASNMNQIADELVAAMANNASKTDNTINGKQSLVILLKRT